MSSIYLQMPISPNNPVYSFEDFKARYLELTGENVPLKPQKNDVGNGVSTHYLMGSWRLTQEHADILASEFPMVTVSSRGVWPAGWVAHQG